VGKQKDAQHGLKQMKLILHHWELDVYKLSVEARKEGARFFRIYDRTIGKLVRMGNEAHKWLLAKSRPRT